MFIASGQFSRAKSIQQSALETLVSDSNTGKMDLINAALPQDSDVITRSIAKSFSVPDLTSSATVSSVVDEESGRARGDTFRHREESLPPAVASRGVGVVHGWYPLWVIIMKKSLLCARVAHDVGYYVRLCLQLLHPRPELVGLLSTEYRSLLCEDMLSLVTDSNSSDGRSTYKDKGDPAKGRMAVDLSTLTVEQTQPYGQETVESTKEEGFEAKMYPLVEASVRVMPFDGPLAKDVRRVDKRVKDERFKVRTYACLYRL